MVVTTSIPVASISTYSRCGRNHKQFIVATMQFSPRTLLFMGSFWPNFEVVFKGNFQSLLGFELLGKEALISRVPLSIKFFSNLGLDFQIFLD